MTDTKRRAHYPTTLAELQAIEQSKRHWVLMPSGRWVKLWDKPEPIGRRHPVEVKSQVWIYR